MTEGTFDSYSWQLIENKQKFIGQIMTSKSPVRSCEDVDEAALTYAEVKALATGNPYIKEKMDLDIQVSKLKLMKANHTSQKYRLEDNITKHYPQQITILKERISGMQTDIQTAKENLPADKEQFTMKVGDKLYTDKKEAGTALVEMCKEIKSVNAPAMIGEYAGFKMSVSFDSFNHKFVMNVKGQLSHNLEIGSDPLGNIARINHALESMPKELPMSKAALASIGLMFAVTYWNDYTHYKLYITDSNLYNFQMKLRSIIMGSDLPQANGGATENTVKNAAIIVIIIPFMIVYPFLQKYFVKGVNIGAVKE